MDKLVYARLFKGFRCLEFNSATRWTLSKDNGCNGRFSADLCLLLRVFNMGKLVCSSLELMADEVMDALAYMLHGNGADARND